MDLQPVFDRMQALHDSLDVLLTKTEQWKETSSTMMPVDFSESVVAISLRVMSKIKLNSARIKVHRYCAFSDIPVFSQRHCDLKEATMANPGVSDQGSMDSQSPCCTSLASAPGFAPFLAATASDDSGSPSPSCFEGYEGHMTPFPFTSNDSSQICLRSGLSIAKAFTSLPYPCPVSSPRNSLATQDWTRLPRTMPSFACCAMQSAYALLNSHHRAYVMAESGTGDQFAVNLLAQCEAGLQSIRTTLENYSIAFEALSGMRGESLSVKQSRALP